MRPYEVLRKAAALLRAKGWCKGVMARNKRGREVDPTSRSAASFCVRGACAAVSPDSERDTYDLLSVVTGTAMVGSYFNDARSTKKRDAIFALDAAAVVALQEEGLEPEDVL